MRVVLVLAFVVAGCIPQPPPEPAPGQQVRDYWGSCLATYNGCPEQTTPPHPVVWYW